MYIYILAARHISGPGRVGWLSISIIIFVCYGCFTSPPPRSLRLNEYLFARNPPLARMYVQELNLMPYTGRIPLIIAPLIIKVLRGHRMGAPGRGRERAARLSRCAPRGCPRCPLEGGGWEERVCFQGCTAIGIPCGACVDTLRVQTHCVCVCGVCVAACVCASRRRSRRRRRSRPRRVVCACVDEWEKCARVFLYMVVGRRLVPRLA